LVVVVCVALCFIVNKYGKVYKTALKSVLADFYNVESLKSKTAFDGRH